MKKKKTAENARSEARERDIQSSPQEKLEWLGAYLERAKLADYVTLLQKPRRLIWLNLLGGAARGFGFAVGFTILGALLIYFLNLLKILDLPLIGDFVTNLIRYIEENKSPGV